MKAKVIKSFRDRITSEVMRSGREIELTEERFGELTTGPLIFVEAIPEENTMAKEEIYDIPPAEKEEVMEIKDEPTKDEKKPKEDKKKKAAKK